MELIASLNGSVALKVSGDDVMPTQNFMARDLIEFVASTYQFSVKPNIPPGIPPSALPFFAFQSGFMTVADNKVPVMQLFIVPNGDIITAATTDLANTILDDFIVKLDEGLGFRFAAAKKSKFYQSNLVVRFEKGMEEKIQALGKIETVLNREINRTEMPFKIKRLAFGYGETNLPQTMSIEAIENSDFLIERRTNEKYSDNRYFCSAPVSTPKHIKILESIENELKG